MTSEFPDSDTQLPTVEPKFTNDVLNAIMSLIITITVWYVFLFYIYPIVTALLGLIGFIIGLLGMWFLLTYTFLTMSRITSTLAYQKASMDTGVPYMNYKTKCPFLQRKRLTFSCQAEQIAPFDVSAFEKCHKEHMWKVCWPERIPSILEVLDKIPLKQKNQLITIVLARMKEQATPAAPKMFEILTNEVEDLETRISAGFALAEMKEELGIEPLIAMVGEYELKVDQTVKAVLARYKDLALPYLIRSIQECDQDVRCSGLVEIMGKIGNENGVPIIETILNKADSGELTRLQSYYALQAIGTEKSYQLLINQLVKASEEDKETIKQIFLSHKMISLPLLIEMLPNPDLSEEHYTLIGDILAEVDSSTYDKFFVKLTNERGAIAAQRLAKILKDNTPDEEEFLKLHQVLLKHLGPSIPDN